jgi:hypothetical protein
MFLRRPDIPGSRLEGVPYIHLRFYSATVSRLHVWRLTRLRDHLSPSTKCIALYGTLTFVSDVHVVLIPSSLTVCHIEIVDCVGSVHVRSKHRYFPQR